MNLARTFQVNAAWEVSKLRRSQRLWLLLIPPIAGPIGTAVSDLYLKIPSQGTALILGLLVTGGLASLILLDLTALSVGEELTLRAHLTFFPLPQSRSAALSGRLAIVLGATLGVYAVGAATTWVLTETLVPQSAGLTPIFPPSHLAFALLALLLFLCGVTAAATIFTRESAQGLVAGALAGVLVAGGTGYLVNRAELTWAFPLILALAGVASLAWAVHQYPRLES
jgi:hypothetical protein